MQDAYLIIHPATGRPNDLLVNAIKRDAKGRLISAWVVNGGWTFVVRKGNRAGCKETGILEPILSIDEAVVPGALRGDYNAKMALMLRRIEGGSITPTTHMYRAEVKPRPCKTCAEPFTPVGRERICPECKQQRAEEAEEKRCVRK